MANNGNNHGCWWLLASNGDSNGINGYWPSMETAMAIGCWPAIDTTDAAMELMVAGQQRTEPRWLVVAGQQWLQQ